MEMHPTDDMFKPSVLDLFSGAGGLALGFQKAGYRVRGGVDLSESACATFRANLKVPALRKDIRKLDEKSLTDLIGSNVDVIVGGPSCQGFSTSGGLSRMDGRDAGDPRNRLFLDYLWTVKLLRPSWIVFENVPGLLLYEQGKVASEIVKAFDKIGYKVSPKILLAANYGVPQLRRRLVFVGNRTGSPIVFPATTHGDNKLWVKYALPFAHLSKPDGENRRAIRPHVSFVSACGDLPEISEDQTVDGVAYEAKALTAYQREMRRDSLVLRQHTAFKLGAAERWAISHLKPGQNWRNLPAESLPERFNRIRPYDATTLYRRLEDRRPAYTITTKFSDPSAGAFIHPSQPRTLSVREAARLQSFPDDFVFHGKPGQICQQIGNAVPPLLAQAVAEAILPSVMRDVHGTTIKALREVFVVEDHGPDVVRLLASGRKTKAAVSEAPAGL